MERPFFYGTDSRNDDPALWEFTRNSKLARNTFDEPLPAAQVAALVVLLVVALLTLASVWLNHQ